MNEALNKIDEQKKATPLKIERYTLREETCLTLCIQSYCYLVVILLAILGVPSYMNSKLKPFQVCF
jgi:hypothetical protein